MAHRITAPEPFTGRIAELVFIEGAATAEALTGAQRLYFATHGYEVTEAEPDIDPLGALTVAQLRERAEAQGIDLAGATLKADIIAALNEAA